MTATPVSSETAAIPLLTSALTYSKCGVGAADDRAQQMTASYFFDRAIRCAASGSHRTRHPYDLDIAIRGAVAEQAVEGPVEQLRGDEVVEPGSDDPELQPFRVQICLDRLRHGILLIIRMRASGKPLAGGRGAAYTFSSRWPSLAFLIFR